MQTFLTEPVRTRDFLEGVNRGLNTFSPGNGNQLDLPMDIANRKNSLTARLEIGIHGNAAIVIQPDIQALERLAGREESDLNDCEGAIDLLAVAQRQPDSFSCKRRGADFR